MSLRARALRAYLRHRVKPRLGAASAITPELVAASRRRLDAIAARIPTPAGVRVHPALPGVGGEWLWPARGARGHGLYLHGGGLPLSLAQQLCTGQDPAPAALALISPWTDLTASGASVRDNAARDQYLCAHLLTPVAQTYLQRHDPHDARASPLFGALGQLPPLTVHVCDSEILRDDSLRLVAGVQAAGGSARLRRYPDLPHVFHAFAPIIPEAKTAIEDLAASLTSTFG